MRKKGQKLNSKQTRFLRGLGHHLSPLAMIGREGLSKSVVDSINDIVTAHELVKVKVQNNCPLEHKETAAELAAKTGAAVAQIIGKTILLYRENHDLDPDKKIKLP